MNKLNVDLRKKAISKLCRYEADSWSDMGTSDFAEIIEFGYKGYADYTDEELVEAVEANADSEEPECAWTPLAAEMRLELAIDKMLEDKS